MSILDERPGDATRRRADAKRQVRAFVDAKPVGVLFCASDVTKATSATFNAVAAELDKLVSKGVLVAADKPGDARRHFKRAGRASR